MNSTIIHFYMIEVLYIAGINIRKETAIVYLYVCRNVGNMSMHI